MTNRSEADPEHAHIEWRVRAGVREVYVIGICNWTAYDELWAVGLPATPARIALWADLTLNPIER